MSWLKSGFDALNQEGERREASYGVPEVWLKQGDKEFRDLLFIEDEPACVHRHTVYINGEYVTFTCLADTGSPETPCCETLGTKKGRNFTGNYTVVDCTPYKDKQGAEGKPAIKLFSAKYKTLQLLKARQEDTGSLVGKVFRFRRTGEKSVTTGDDVSLLREADMGKAFQAAHYKGKPFSELIAKEAEKLSKTFNMKDMEKTNKLVSLNYMQVLKPKTVAEIRALLKGYKPKSDDNDSTGSPSEKADDVPF